MFPQPSDPDGHLEAAVWRAVDAGWDRHRIGRLIREVVVEEQLSADGHSSPPV